ncbi:MAG: helix-turn-helix transcriptional regulator [Bacteroidaceae bacterium]|nr:helix-turn-helix transcriptional regulator [Bacteroidaceae bacterium]
MQSNILQKLDKESNLIFDKVAAKMRTAARIADAMEAAGLSKSQFARKMGKSPSEITKWLSGTHNFTIDSLQEISAVLGVEISSAIDEPMVYKMDYSVCESPTETIPVTIPTCDHKLLVEIARKFGWLV